MNILAGNTGDCKAHLDSGASYSQVPPTQRRRIVDFIKKHDTNNACTLILNGEFTCNLKPNDL